MVVFILMKGLKKMKKNKTKLLREEVDIIKNRVMNNYFDKRKWLNAKRQKDR